MAAFRAGCRERPERIDAHHRRPQGNARRRHRLIRSPRGGLNTQPATGAGWREFVGLQIGPHLELSETQKRAIALDYGMRGDRAKIRVRKALLYYALERFDLDTDPGARHPQDRQIVLLNQELQRAAVGATAVEG